MKIAKIILWYTVWTIPAAIILLVKFGYSLIRYESSRRAFKEVLKNL